MSSTLRNTIIVIVIVIIIGILLYFSSSSQPASQNPTGQTSPTNTQSMTGNTGAVINSQDSSDASINSDLSNIDTQIKGLNTDSTNIDQSLTTK